MKYTKMKHFFNLTLTCLTISLMASAVFAGEAVRASGYRIDELASNGSADNTQCALPRALVETRIEKALRTSGFHNRATYGIYNFKIDLGMTNKDVDDYFDSVGEQFGFVIPQEDRVRITHSEALVAYASKAASANCSMQAQAQ